MSFSNWKGLNKAYDEYFVPQIENLPELPTNILEEFIKGELDFRVVMRDFFYRIKVIFPCKEYSISFSSLPLIVYTYIPAKALFPL